MRVAVLGGTRAIRLVAERPELEGRVYNVGEARTWSIEQWARRILAAAGSDAELVRVPDDALPTDLRITASVAQHMLVDSGALRAAVGWTDTDPERALGQSVQWHLDHQPAAVDPNFGADDVALAQAVAGRAEAAGQP